MIYFFNIIKLSNSQSKEFVLISEIFWQIFWKDNWRSLIFVIKNFHFGVNFFSSPQISVQLQVDITAMEHLFDKSATWACLIWEKFMNWIPWKMEGRNVLSQTNSTSHRMPVLSCAQLGEYTYKNIYRKVEKYNSTFDFHHPFYFFLFCLFGLFVYIQVEMFVQKNYRLYGSEG